MMNDNYSTKGLLNQSFKPNNFVKAIEKYEI